MKSKFTTYLLIAAVVVIWGLIVKRVFFSQDKPPVVQSRTSSVVADDKVADSLLLNYRDPFGASRDKPEAVPATKAPTKPEPQVSVAEPFNIRFVGSINHNQKAHYIVELSGRQYTITIGSEVGGFRLMGIDGGRLHFTKNNQSYYLAY